MKTERISDTINKITLENGDEITLVGTAHVSEQSVAEVEKVIDEVEPDMVCLELDRGRFDSKTKENSYASMNLKKVFKEGKTFLVLANTALASFQKKMGNQTGSAPGEEILGAAKIAQDRNIPFCLCDREIAVTFKRAWGMSSFWNKIKLLSTLLSTAFDKEEISAEELEQLKKTDTLQEMLQELSKELPGAKKALIDERDRYLATNIFKAEGHKKVAVIGAGHAGGIINTIKELENGRISPDLSEISQAPKPSAAGKIIGWAIPVALVAFIVYSCFTYGFENGVRYFLIWAACNAGSSMLLTMLSNAHPLNWLVAALSAPVAVMNPLIGVGVFTGIAESELRKPQVKDFETISDDISSFKGWFKNKVLHCFLIFFTSSLGSILGTFVLFPVFLKIFG